VPQISLSAGETEGLLTLNRWDVLDVRTDGDIRVGKHETTARTAPLTPAGERTSKFATKNGEDIYVYAEENATVTYRSAGFLDIIFPRQSVTIDDIQSGSVDVSGDVTVDQITSRAGVDIEAQSIGNLENDVVLQSSFGVTGVNADQQTDLPASDTQVTTIRADAGEVWTISDIRLGAFANGSASSGTHRFTVSTEDVAAEISFAESNFSDDLLYGSGQWHTATVDSRTDMIGTKIDENDGIDVIYNNDTDATQTSDRRIRFQFEVTKVA
jgi:hypothetical protein